MVFYAGHYVGQATGFEERGARLMHRVLYTGGSGAWPFTGNIILESIYLILTCPD